MCLHKSPRNSEAQSRAVTGGIVIGYLEEIAEYLLVEFGRDSGTSIGDTDTHCIGRKQVLSFAAFFGDAAGL